MAAPATGPASAYLRSFGNKNELLETIRASLEENRVDLYLQPTVSLPQRKLRYYDALSRLRDAGGPGIGIEIRAVEKFDVIGRRHDILCGGFHKRDNEAK